VLPWQTAVAQVLFFPRTEELPSMDSEIIELAEKIQERIVKLRDSL